MIVIASIVVSIVVYIRSIIYLDPDFGWHLVTGQKILSTGFPSFDPFSYTMSSYLYIDHAWLSDVVIAAVFPTIGHTGLSLIYGTLYLSVFAFLFLSFKLHKANRGLITFCIGILVLAVSATMSFYGVRTQVISWLFFAIVFVVSAEKKHWQKYRIFLPFIFLLWANFHGSFVVGLLVLYVNLLSSVVKHKRISDVCVILLCSLIWLLNPYGVHLFDEVRDTISSDILKMHIAEWQPAYLTLNLPVYALLPFSLSVLWKYRLKINLSLIFLYALLFIQMLQSVRHTVLWVIVASYVVLLGANYFWIEVRKDKLSIKRFGIAARVFLFIALGIFVFQSVRSIQEASNLSENQFYPKQAVTYLERNLPEGNIFSEYGWGGYLIWKLPHKKVFIDGRMAIWKTLSPPSNETDSAMEDYVELLDGTLHHKLVFEKYNITTVLWPKEETRQGDSNGLVILVAKVLQKFKGSLGAENEGFSFIKSLERSGWEKVYEDEVTVIYQKSGVR